MLYQVYLSNAGFEFWLNISVFGKIHSEKCKGISFRIFIMRNNTNFLFSNKQFSYFFKEVLPCSWLDMRIERSSVKLDSDSPNVCTLDFKINSSHIFSDMVSLPNFQCILVTAFGTALFHCWRESNAIWITVQIPE